MERLEAEENGELVDELRYHRPARPAPQLDHLATYVTLLHARLERTAPNVRQKAALSIAWKIAATAARSDLINLGLKAFLR